MRRVERAHLRSGLTASAVLLGLAVGAPGSPAPRPPRFEVAAIRGGDATPAACREVLSTCKEPDLPGAAGRLAALASRCLRSPDRRLLLLTTRAAGTAAGAGEPAYVLGGPLPQPVAVGGGQFRIGAWAAWSPGGNRLAAVGSVGARAGEERDQPFIIDPPSGALSAAGQVAGSAFLIAWCRGEAEVAVLAAPHPEESGDLLTGDLYLGSAGAPAARRLSTGEQLIGMACSPDGELLAAADGAAIRILLYGARRGDPRGELRLAGAGGQGHLADRIKSIWWQSGSALAVVTGYFDGMAWSGERTFVLKLSPPG